MIGRSFGRLTVLSRAGKRRGEVLWSCLCGCGTERTVSNSKLLTGNTRSCGCLKRELAATRAAKRNMTHGMYGTRAYRSYCCAKYRCNNPRNDGYASYGGRGIKFLFTSFKQFYAELGPRPRGTSIDRINPDGNYEPGNVRWATPLQQTHNRRSRRSFPLVHPASFQKGLNDLPSLQNYGHD